MPTELNSFIKEPGRGGKILVRHCFYGETAEEAEKWKRHHLESCEYFRAAEKEGRTIDIPVEVDELPEFDEEALEEFLELDDEDEDEEDEEEEEEQEVGGEG